MGHYVWNNKHQIVNKRKQKCRKLSLDIGHWTVICWCEKIQQSILETTHKRVNWMKNKTHLKQSIFYSHKFNKIYNNRLVHKYLRGNSFYTPSLSRNKETWTILLEHLLYYKHKDQYIRFLDYQLYLKECTTAFYDIAVPFQQDTP